MRGLTMGQLLDAVVEAHPENAALAYVDRNFRMTFREFGGLVDGLAKGLVSLGVRPGEKVAVWAANVPYWIALQFAAAKIGAVFLTVSTSFRPNEVRHILAHAEAENLFITDGFGDLDHVQTLNDMVPELRSRQRGDLRCPAFPRLRRVMFLGQEKHRGMYTMPEIMGLGRMVLEQEYLDRQANVKPEHVAVMHYTAGTTGEAKGAMLTHKSVVVNGRTVGANQRLTHRDRVCLPVPLFNSFGCVLGVLAAMACGSTLVVLESFDPVQVMAAVDHEKCTALYGTPSMFRAVLDNKLFDRFDFSSLRTGVVAGAPCPPQTVQRIMDDLHMPAVAVCYGLTEAASVIAMTLPDDTPEMRAAGRLAPLPGVDVRVCAEDGCSMAPGAHGEVRCRGYNVMKGYYKDPEATAAALDEEGWLRTGDVGALDEEGRLTITSRIKDMIIHDGEHISPLVVEEFLLTLDGVAQVQVVGVPSAEHGEDVVAFVVLAEGAPLTREDIRDACRGAIAKYKRPRHVVFVEEFPRSAGGDVQKFKLRDMAAAMFATQTA
ncbi:MAG: AMP-binding protein [Desulfovibrionaceae bacterium]